MVAYIMFDIWILANLALENPSVMYKTVPTVGGNPFFGFLTSLSTFFSPSLLASFVLHTVLVFYLYSEMCGEWECLDQRAGGTSHQQLYLNNLFHNSLKLVSFIFHAIYLVSAVIGLYLWHRVHIIMVVYCGVGLYLCSMLGHYKLAVG